MSVHSTVRVTTHVWTHLEVSSATATKVTSSMAWLTVEVSHALWEFLCYKNNAHFLCSKETSNRKLMLVNPLALLGRILGKHFQWELRLSYINALQFCLAAIGTLNKSVKFILRFVSTLFCNQAIFLSVRDFRFISRYRSTVNGTNQCV